MSVGEVYLWEVAIPSRSDAGGGFRPKSTSFPSPVPMWRKACRRLDDEHVTPPLLPTGLEKFCLADLVPALEEEEEEEEQALSEFDPIPIHHVISVSR